MSTPKIILTLVLLLSIHISYGQSGKFSIDVTSPKIINHYKQSNLVIENMLIEFTMLDWTKDNNKKLWSLAKTTHYLKQSRNSFTTFENDETIRLFRGQVQPFIAFSNLENRFKGTVSVHQLPEKYPQVVPAVPSILTIQAPPDNRPKSFGALYKF